MKKQNFLNTFSIIIGIFITFIISVKADSNDNDECLACDFLIGLVIGACDSNPECSAIMTTVVAITTIFLVIILSISFLCCMDTNEKRTCMKKCCDDRPSLGKILSTGAGYETGRSLFS